ncbi:MAG TPA: hypothetical protein VNK43_00810 [Gemmatimonadales bacterium]|nr:hypothetical protein [Gemmatimonadales bacterium]
MRRALSVSRVAVAPEREADYLAAVGELAALTARRGGHIWVFRSTREPHVFLEFSESPSAMSHRVHASRTQEELRLEARLREVATYAPGSWDLWEEVPLDARRDARSDR